MSVDQTVRSTRAEELPAAPPHSVPDLNGDFGPYSIVQKLGQGGMGAVYKARHRKLDKLVALKVLPAHLVRHPQAVARFEREMRAVGKLEHLNIVRAMDAGEVSGAHYVAMELVEGSDLAALVRKRGPMSVPKACKALRQAAQGLDAAHQAGLVHRDLKPSNLMLSRSGHIKIMDFGLARLADETSPPSELTGADQVLGTPDYMAPEQWESTHSAEPRTDLYALGCTLYFLLAGRPPFGTDKYRLTAHKMKGHLFDSPPDLRSANSDVPEGLNDLYLRLMAKRPNDRPASARELAEALAPFTGSASSSSTLSTPELPTVSIVIDTTEPLSGLHESTIRSGIAPGLNARVRDLAGRPAFVAAASAIVVLLVIAGIWGLNRGRGTPDSNAEPTKVASPTKPGRKPKPDDDKAHSQDSSGTGEPESIAAVESGAASGTTAPQPGAAATPMAAYLWSSTDPPAAIAPFTAEKADELQRAWAIHLGLPVSHRNSAGLRFQLIPPGEFLMGSTPEEIESTLEACGKDEQLRELVRSESPQRRVVVTRPFYLSATEVSQAQYLAVVGANPSHFSRQGAGKEAVQGRDPSALPVDSVSWFDAAEFCLRLSLRERLAPFQATASTSAGYRLPREAEWEFACRAGSTGSCWLGTQEELSRAGWLGVNSKGVPQPAGSLAANPFGIRDMHGSVWEWTLDWWQTGPESQSLAIDPTGPATGTQRVCRGGSIYSAPAHGRSSTRSARLPTSRDFQHGFRVVLDVDGLRTLMARAQTATTVVPSPAVSTTGPKPVPASPGASGPPLAELPQALRREIETASGLVTDEFAMCQSMSYVQFTKLIEKLREHGCRPVVFRPYFSGENLRVSAIWLRDRSPWKFETDAGKEAIQSTHDALSAMGYSPTMLTAVQNRSGALNYAAVWAQVPGPRGTFELSFTPPAGEFEETSKRGLYPYRRNKFRMSNGTVIETRIWTLTTGGKWSSWNLTRSNYEAMQAQHRSGGLVQHDVWTSLEDRNEMIYGGGWRTWPPPAVEWHAFTDLALPDHLSKGRELAGQGYVPVSLSVVQPAKGVTRASSVWHRSVPR